MTDIYKEMTGIYKKLKDERTVGTQVLYNGIMAAPRRVWRPSGQPVC
jgi:hypothetical protein